MGGKTGTTTQQVSIPPEVLARYNSVNAQAQQTAAQPFQQYSTDPNAFVAPLNQQQQAGIGNINQYATSAQPAYGAALQGTAQAYQGYNPQNYQQGVAGYMNPFVSQAMGSTAAYLQNQNQQQQQQILGQGISAGAFGGDRGKIAQAALAGQQNLATGNVLANMASTGYQNAAQNYMAGLGQQGALAGQLGTLGAGAQTAGLAGAQAQLGAGTLGQQTQQAGNTALYNQFLQQQAYPFQVAQFLANIAEGTGALSGSTTTTQQPMPFFSDRRLKEDIKKIGTAYNGLPIYTYKYKGDDTEQTHIGFMADEVEKKHPEAVGLAGGYKTVDYEKASRPAHYSGGLVSEGGAVGMQHMGEGYADGGYADTTAFGKYDPYDINSFYNLLNRQQTALKNPNAASMRQMGGEPGLAGRVPDSKVSVGQLMTAGSAPSMPESVLQQGLGAADEIEQGGKLFTGAKDYLNKAYEYMKTLDKPTQAQGGLVGYADGGDIPYETSNDPMEKVAKNSQQPERKLATAANPPGNPSQSGLGMGDLLGASKLAGSMGGLGATSQLPGLYSAASAPLPDVVGAMATGGEEAFAAPEAASGLGAAMSGIGDAAMSALPIILAPFGLSSGGLVPREHHADGDVVGDEGGLDSKLQYKIAPQSLADMDAAQQQVVKNIYQGESGGKYNILNGGEEFDPSQGHPHRVGKGGQSTAAGAGQFIGETWDRVTGGAPMTPAYQDAATWQLANDDYKKRTGRDLRQDVSENGFTPEIKKALAPTWTSLAQKEPSKTNGDLFSGLGNMFGIGSAQAQEQQQNQGGLLPQTGLISEQTIIPLLSGLGAMASSKSPYLGAAILQGLGGGAKAYEDVRTQQMERQALSPVISQRNIATTNALQTGLMQFNAMRDANGQPPISMQEFAKLSGYQGNLPTDAQAITGQTGVFGQPAVQPAAGQTDQGKVGLAPAPTLQQMHSGTVVRDGIEIPLGNDPASLQSFINKYKGVGGTGSFLEGQVKAYEDRLTEINNTKLTRDVNGNSIPALGVLAASRKAALAENVTKNIQSQYNDATDFEKSYAVNNQLINNIAEYSRLANMNRATPELAEAIGRLSSIPGFDAYIKPDMATLQKANDSGTKSAVISALQTLSENAGSAQKSVLQEALHAVATPSINPGSRHDIVANAKAKLEQQHDLNQAWLAEGVKNNGQYPEPVLFTSQFNKANPLESYLEKAKKDIPPFAGQAQSEGNRTVTRTGIVQDGPNAGKKAIQYSDGSVEIQ